MCTYGRGRYGNAAWFYNFLTNRFFELLTRKVKLCENNLKNQ